MSIDLDISQEMLEDFCVNFLKSKGYTVHLPNVFNNEVDNERDLILYFYSKVREVVPEGSNFSLGRLDIDLAILKKLLNKLEESGLSYEENLRYIADMINYLFKYPQECGGPYKSFRIFSSEGFFENLVYKYEINKTLNEEIIWDKQAEEDFANRQINMNEVVRKLRDIKEKF